MNSYYKICENTIEYHKTTSFFGVNNDTKMIQSQLLKLLIEHIVIYKLQFGWILENIPIQTQIYFFHSSSKTSAKPPVKAGIFSKSFKV